MEAALACHHGVRISKSLPHESAGDMSCCVLRLCMRAYDPRRLCSRPSVPARIVLPLDGRLQLAAALESSRSGCARPYEMQLRMCAESAHPSILARLAVPLLRIESIPLLHLLAVCFLPFRLRMPVVSSDDVLLFSLGIVSFILFWDVRTCVLPFIPSAVGEFGREHVVFRLLFYIFVRIAVYFQCRALLTPRPAPFYCSFSVSLSLSPLLYRIFLFPLSHSPE